MRAGAPDVATHRGPLDGNRTRKVQLRTLPLVPSSSERTDRHRTRLMFSDRSCGSETDLVLHDAFSFLVFRNVEGRRGSKPGRPSLARCLRRAPRFRLRNRKANGVVSSVDDRARRSDDSGSSFRLGMRRERAAIHSNRRESALSLLSIGTRVPRATKRSEFSRARGSSATRAANRIHLAHLQAWSKKNMAHALDESMCACD